LCRVLMLTSCECWWTRTGTIRGLPVIG
jgi:hypothetical protein